MNQSRRREVLKLGLFSCAALITACDFKDFEEAKNEAPTTPAAPAPTPAPAPAPAPGPAPAPSPGPAPAPSPPSPPGAWNVNPWLTFPAGGNFVLDLSKTLPAVVARGGDFAIDPSGAALPAGISLSNAGLLAVGGGTIVNVSGVIFRYTPPA
jgi:hypothetical protein